MVNLSEGFKSAASARLRKNIEKSTSSLFRGLLVGTAVTCIIQSRLFDETKEQQKYIKLTNLSKIRLINNRDRADIKAAKMIRWIKINRSKYYDWLSRYGKVNEHNAWVPRDFWLTDCERRNIIDYYHDNPLEGYRSPLNTTELSIFFVTPLLESLDSYY